MADLLDEMQGPDVPAPKPLVTFRRFDDIDQHRKDIYDNALKGVVERFPLKNATHRLEVSDVRYNPTFKEPTKKDEKDAILNGGRLQRPIQGKLRLVDNATNQVLDERTTTLAHVPHMTSRGTFIHNGTSWGVRNQARLRPGVYVRKQQNGGVEAHFNTEPGTGRGFRVNLEPESGLFKLQIGQSTTRLYPLLKALGVDDEALKKAWGDDLFKANWRGVTGHDTQDIKKVVEKLGRKAEREAGDDKLPQTLRGILDRTRLDPDTTQLTLGKRHEAPTPDVLTSVTQKILRVARDEEPGDNRDSQAFQSIHSAEDFFRERLKRDQSAAGQKLLWKATRDKNLGALQSGLLTPNIHALFRGSGLTHAAEETNPLETYDLRQGITRMGEGGISSAQSVSKDARGVQPSHLGMIDSARAPESAAIGMDMRVTDAALKGSDNQLYTTLKDSRTGKPAVMSALQMAGKTVAFPGEMADKTKKKVRAMVGENIKFVNRNKVDYEIPGTSHMFSRAANMIPFIEGSKSKRLAMGSRMLTQAMPLQNPEAPLVQSIDHEGKSFYEGMGGHVGAVHADKPGHVIDMSPDHITVLSSGGEKKEYQLYNNMPLARKTLLHNTPAVKVGDTVQPGQLLASSNFTDKHGRAAPGLNLRVGYLSGHGGTYEDAIVISSGAAKRLTSEHQYKQTLDLGPEIHSTKTADYRAIYGDKYTPEQFKKLDDDGVVRVGQTINPGDPLIVAVGKKQGRAVGALMKSEKSSHTDATQTWEHPQPGVVTDVARTRSGIKVAVKSFEPMTLGSKLSGLYGNKGVVSAIIPDDQMPHDEEGKPLELLMGPTGIITRANPASLAHTLLGKIAAKTGKPYQVKSFGTQGSLADYALAEARKHGVKETETLTDPRDGRKLPNVFIGHQYIVKLHHTAEGKLSARDTGGYAVDESPAKGGPTGSKRIGLLDDLTLISHGATEFLKDAKLVRGQRNDDYWRALKSGQTPTVPRESFANKHFLSLLKAAGVNVRDQGRGKTQLSYMTDRDVDAMAQHEVANSGTYDFNTMKPVQDGLFDLGKTGGADGTRWAKIKLPVKIPNPLAQDPIVRMLGLTNKKFEQILSGQERIDGKTGPEAIEHALKGIDVAKAIEQSKQEIKGSSGANRDIAVKKLGYLVGLQKQGLKPEELMISKLPLLPPKYRPVLRARGLDMIHDANYLYHDLLEAGKNYSEHQKEFGDAGGAYLNLYNSAKAVAGVANPVDPKHAEQGIRGMLRFAIGVKDSPKFSRFQRKVLGNSVDTIGRGVATIDPAMDMDSVGLPEDMAWTEFKPFVIGRLVRNGMPASEAVKAVKNRSKEAERALETEMSERPVVWNRAPALHKFNYVGAMAHINYGRSDISTPQAATAGANLDYDGDQLNVHVPVSKEAVDEVKAKLLPSRNLLHPNSFDVHYSPSQEFLLGLYLASQKDPKKQTKVFATKADALAAYTRGELQADTPVQILNNT